MVNKTVLGLDSLSHHCKIYQAGPVNYLIGGFRSALQKFSKILHPLQLIFVVVVIYNVAPPLSKKLWKSPGLLSAHVERFSVSFVRDFLLKILNINLC